MKNLFLTLVLLSIPFVMTGQDAQDREKQIVHIKKCKRDIEITEHNTFIAIDFQDEIPIRELIREDDKKWGKETAGASSMLTSLDSQELMSVLSKVISRQKMNRLKNEKITFSIKAEPEGKIVAVSFLVSQKVLDVLSFEDLCKLNIRIKEEVRYDHSDKHKKYLTFKELK